MAMTTLRQQFLQNVAQTSPSPLMIEVERAEGVYFYTTDGRRIVDLVSGVSVSNVGHGNAAVVAAVQRQAGEYMHTMVYGETVMRPQVDYAAALARATELGSVYFVNSGAEAIEGAMKLAKRTTGRSGFVSFEGAYHGSTQGAMSIMGGEFFKSSYRPLLPDCRTLRFNSFEDLEQITERTAAVVAECVQGEAGVQLPDEGFLQALRSRCTEVGALLIIDEIQTGMGRCGTLFAHTQYGIRPDILCLAKALGGGMPLGAFVADGELMRLLTHSPVLGHITTFGGHPVSAAAGLAAMNFINDNDLCSHAAAMGKLFEELLAGCELRRSGLLMAVELGSAERMYDVVGKLLAAGYMSDWFLFCDTAFRISPPLTITADEVEQCCKAIKRII